MTMDELEIVELVIVAPVKFDPEAPPPPAAKEKDAGELSRTNGVKPVGLVVERIHIVDAFVDPYTTGTSAPSGILIVRLKSDARVKTKGDEIEPAFVTT